MENLEAKSVKVHPELEQEMIERHEHFGWKLKSSQEIHSQTSHQEEDAIFTYHYVTTTNYVKLVFNRERDVENKDVIKQLEDEYWNCIYTYYGTPSFMPKKKIFGIIAGVTWIPSLLVLLLNGMSSFWEVFPAMILGISPIILRFFLYYLPKKKEGDKCLQRSFDIEREIQEMNK